MLLFYNVRHNLSFRSSVGCVFMLHSVFVAKLQVAQLAVRNYTADTGSLCCTVVLFLCLLYTTLYTTPCFVVSCSVLLLLSVSLLILITALNYLLYYSPGGEFHAVTQRENFFSPLSVKSTYYSNNLFIK